MRQNINPSHAPVKPVDVEIALVEPKSPTRPSLLNAVGQTAPPHIQRLIPRAAIFWYLVTECLPGLSDRAHRAVKDHWQLTDREIDKLPLCGCPTERQNMMAAHACLERFGPRALTPDLGFYSFSRPRDLCDCAGECVCDLQTYRLDIDAWLSDRGLILPIYDPQTRWIVDLKVYRSTEDQRPFSLRVRERRAA